MLQVLRLQTWYKAFQALSKVDKIPVTLSGFNPHRSSTKLEHAVPSTHEFTATLSDGDSRKIAVKLMPYRTAACRIGEQYYPLAYILLDKIAELGEQYQGSMYLDIEPTDFYPFAVADIVIPNKGKVSRFPVQIPQESVKCLSLHRNEYDTLLASGTTIHRRGRTSIPVPEVDVTALL